MVVLLALAAPAAAQPSEALSINFDATAATAGTWHGGQASGTFTATGALTDAGRMRLTYRLFGQSMDATTTLIGAKGILTIGQHATVTTTIDHQTVAGRWHTCGGTGPYRRFSGHGDWIAAVDMLATPTGIVPRALHGSYRGRGHWRSARKPANPFTPRESWC